MTLHLQDKYNRKSFKDFLLYLQYKYIQEIVCHGLIVSLHLKIFYCTCLIENL